jgi:iron complex outermembrane receptor protein
MRQDVIVTASISPVSFDAVTRSVATVTREDLERLGLTTLADALRFLPGVDLRARGPRGVQTDILVRGATFGQSLVLVDGLRLNDSQSGHHNAEIPMALSGLARVELLSGAGSAVHGADALGGTINVISRSGPHASVTFTAGQHGYAGAEGSVAGRGLPPDWTLTGWASRSGGFMFDRDFRQGGAALRGPIARGWSADVRHQRRAFGANGFYGASPSFEWTDQTLAATRWAGTAGAWTTAVRGQYRNHGDHFRWDINRPGFAENRHRTDAVEAVIESRRALGARGRLAIGGASGGDWIDSSNLGDRRYARGSLFAETDWSFGARASAQAGLRVDGYSTFGRSVSPSVSVGAWLGPDVRLRASAARAFRIPTYTELYYRDPAHQASRDLRPERGWSLDGGLDWSREAWLVSVSPYRRWDEDVIDWVKAAPADLWRTTNVRDVATTGVEVSVTRRWQGALARAFVTAQDVDAPALTLLSKYVLDYATRSAGVSVAAPIAGGVRAAITLDYRRRQDGQSYTLGGLRVSRAVLRAELFVDVANAFDERYTEVAGVAMPGRWVTVGVQIR